jgi:hypothetical protein
MGRLSLISPLKARDPEEAHRVTTQLELFFDLARTAQAQTLGQNLLERLVPRGGLRQVNQFNDLRKSGTINLPI